MIAYFIFLVRLKNSYFFFIIVKKTTVSLIVAMTKNGVIGKDGSLPWNIPEELKLFKEKTLEKAVVMGRKTWNSLPEKLKPLPDRVNIVLSHQDLILPKDVNLVKSIEEAIEVGSKCSSEIVFIGGGEVYSQVLDKVDKLYVSWIKKDFDGDVYFPEFDFSNCDVLERVEMIDFEFFEYKM